MLSQHNAMNSFSINKHLLDVLSLDDVLVNHWRLGAIEVVQICLGHNLLPFSQSPELSVLQVYVFEMVVVQIWESILIELERILKSHLVLLEAKHVVYISATGFMVFGSGTLTDAKV